MDSITIDYRGRVAKARVSGITRSRADDGSPVSRHTNYISLAWPDRYFLALDVYRLQYKRPTASDKRPALKNSGLAT